MDAIAAQFGNMFPLVVILLMIIMIIPVFFNWGKHDKTSDDVKPENTPTSEDSGEDKELIKSYKSSIKHPKGRQTSD